MKLKLQNVYHPKLMMKVIIAMKRVILATQTAIMMSFLSVRCAVLFSL